MNLPIVAKVLGFLIMGLSAIGIIPLLVAIGYQDPRGPWPWLVMTACAFVVALALLFCGRQARGEDLSIREGIAITSCIWILASLIGAIGILLAVPQLDFISAWFESMSGFTTTGSSVFGTEILISELPRGVLIWRHIMQWLGGLGIVVISLSLLPLITGGGGFSLYRAEMPGITNERLAPRIADTARLLVIFYTAVTILCAFALWLVGAKPFTAIGHAMSSIATGGFSSFDDSIDGFQSEAAEWIIILGMLAGGLSFAMLLGALRGRPLRIWQNAESRIFLCLIAFAIVVTAVTLHFQSDFYNGNTHDLWRHASFNIVSTATSSGFAVGHHATPDGGSWSSWPPGTQMLLIALMIIGGCTGGTAGGSKVIRWVVAWKALRSELRRAVEPSRVTVVSIDGKPLGDRVLLQVGSFFIILVICWAIGTLIISLEGHGLDTAAGAAITAVSNNGPGLGEVRVGGSFSALGPVSQLTCILLMLIGRLEFFGIIALCSWRHWRR
ncbi:MAG: TrkH family potassium uptake protein [Planctomycetota bacterium]|nr:MAG: TrkH family potassium uptake protein [Planctomycetota bacterium]